MDIISERVRRGKNFKDNMQSITMTALLFGSRRAPNAWGRMIEQWVHNKAKTLLMNGKLPILSIVYMYVSMILVVMKTRCKSTLRCVGVASFTPRGPDFYDQPSCDSKLFGAAKCVTCIASCDVMSEVMVFGDGVHTELYTVPAPIQLATL